MYKSLKISVVIPAFNEEKLILDTLSNIPEFIDSIFVIDDCSYDNTKNILEKFSKKNKMFLFIGIKTTKVSVIRLRKDTCSQLRGRWTLQW